MEIGFNCRYLADALRAIPSEEVCLELKNGLSPIVLTPVREQDDFAYMVLPKTKVWRSFYPCKSMMVH